MRCTNWEILNILRRVVIIHIFPNDFSVFTGSFIDFWSTFITAYNTSNVFTPTLKKLSQLCFFQDWLKLKFGFLLIYISSCLILRVLFSQIEICRILFNKLLIIEINHLLKGIPLKYYPSNSLSECSCWFWQVSSFTNFLLSSIGV